MGKSPSVRKTKKVVSPIVEAIWDEPKKTRFMEKYGLVPYYGSGKYSSHSSLKLLYDLGNNSTSFSTVIQFYRNFGLNKFYFTNTEISCLHLKEDESNDDTLDNTEQRNIANVLSECGFDFDYMCDLTLSYLKDHRTCGNMFAVIEEIELDEGAKSIRVDYKSPLRVMRLYREEGSVIDKAIVFNTSALSEDKSKKDSHTIYSVYPNWDNTALGRRTILHMKTGVGFYGRPPDPASIRPKYIEYSNLDTACSIGAKAITTMMIMFFQEDSMRKIETGPQGEPCDEEDQVNPYEQRSEAVRDVLTSEGQGHTVASIPYTGDTPPTIKELDLKRDTAWWKTQMQVASEKILIENTVPLSLAQGKTSSSDLGGKTGNQLSQEFKISCLTAVLEEQKVHERFWNTIVKIYADFFGKTELENKSIKFTNKVKELFEIEEAETDNDSRD